MLQLSAWKSISESFNQNHPFSTRTPEQLLAKYENLKNRSRKYAAMQKQSMYSTGGGPSSAHIDTILEKVLNIINKKTVYGERNDYDDDFIQNVNTPQSDACDTSEKDIDDCIKNIEETEYMQLEEIDSNQLEIINKTIERSNHEEKEVVVKNRMQDIGNRQTCKKQINKATKPKFPMKRKQPKIEDILLQVKCDYYNRKMRLLDLQCQLTEEDIKNRKLQNELLVKELGNNI